MKLFEQLIKSKKTYLRFAASVIGFIFVLSFIFKFGTKDDDDADNTWRALIVAMSVFFYGGLYLSWKYKWYRLKQSNNKLINNQ